MRLHTGDHPNHTLVSPLANMIHDTFGCSDSVYDSFVPFFFFVENSDQYIFFELKFVGAYHSLATGEQFHFAGRIIDIAIRRTRWTIFGCTFAVDRTRFTYGTRIAARSNVRQSKGSHSDTARLNAKHASIQIGSSVCAANGVLFGGATMNTRRTTCSFASTFLFLERIYNLITYLSFKF